MTDTPPPAGTPDAPDRPTLVRLGYAHGWSFTPLDGKVPNTKRWQKLPRETLDTALAWATEGNIGLRTGPEPSSGVIVLDVDSPTVPESIRHLTHTVTARTGRGGWHFYYRAPSDCPGNRAGIVIDGIKCDVRGRGGQVVYPGSIHPDTGTAYTFAPGYGPGEVALADWPGDLLAAPATTLPSLPPVPSHLPPVPNRRADAYAHSALMLEARNVATAVSGTRNHTLNAAAFSLGQLVGSGVLTEAEVVDALTHAARRCGLSDTEARQTIESGLRAGRAKPREIPPAPPAPAVQTVTARPVASDPAAPVDTLILDTKRPVDTAIAYLRRHHTDPRTGLRTLQYYSDTFWEWTNNRYQPIEDKYIEHLCQPWMHSAYVVGPKDSLKPFPADNAAVSNAVACVARQCLIRETTTLPAWLDGRPQPTSRGGLIPLRNGTLDIASGQLIPPTPALFNTAACEFDYDPNPPEPSTWYKLLVDMFDTDYQQAELLQEMAGYLLTTDTSYQKIFAIIGPKRAGKGTIVRTFTRLIGAGNVCSPTVDSLAQPFGLAPMIGKSVATINDARFHGPNVPTVLERMLCISGEDPLTIDRKYKESQTIRLPTRIVISSNEIPRVIDASGALAGRIMLIRLTQSFYGREDPDLERKLIPELPGIFHWALAGLRRLHARGRFVQPDSCREAIQEMEDLASPVGAFVRDMCEPFGIVYVDDLYKLWLDWCEQEGRDYSAPKQTFSRDLRAVLPGVRTRQDTYNKRYFEGVSIKR